MWTVIFQIGHKSTGNQNKNRQVGLHQTKKLLHTAKEIIDGMKMQPMEWEKIFTNHVSVKGLVSKICKELIQLNSEKQPDLKTGRGPENSRFSKDTQMTNRSVESCSTS